MLAEADEDGSESISFGEFVSFATKRETSTINLVPMMCAFDSVIG